MWTWVTKAALPFLKENLVPVIIMALLVALFVFVILQQRAIGDSKAKIQALETSNTELAKKVDDSADWIAAVDADAQAQDAITGSAEKVGKEIKDEPKTGNRRVGPVLQHGVERLRR